MVEPCPNGDGPGSPDLRLLRWGNNRRSGLWAPKTLAELADLAGYSQADVAVLAGVNRSTISRLWTAADWVAPRHGKAVMAVAQVVPGVADQLARLPLAGVADLAPELADYGFPLDLAAIDRLVEAGEVMPQHLLAALTAARLILHREPTEAARHLTRFWGRDQDLALGHLFDTGSTRIGDPTELFTAASDTAEALTDIDTPHAWMGYTTIVHHTAKATGLVLNGPGAGLANDDRRAAFLRRSTTIGLTIASGDYSLVDRYAATLDRSRVASIVEDWSLPTYSRDAAPTPSFDLPQRLTLTRTAGELIRELTTFPDAYVYYLARVGLPRVIRRDPTLGGRLVEVAAAARRRLAACSEPTASTLARLLATPELTA